jgi:hypothetical protein
MIMRATRIGPVGTLLASGRLGQHPRLLGGIRRSRGDTTLAAVTEAFRVDLGQSRVVDRCSPTR